MQVSCLCNNSAVNLSKWSTNQKHITCAQLPTNFTFTTSACDRRSTFCFLHLLVPITTIITPLVPPATMNTLTYLLTPWHRVLLEKLTGSEASQEIPRIFGARRFITVLTSARHLSLSWANSIQSPQHPPTSWRSILILSSHLRLHVWISPMVSFPQVFPPEPCAPLSPPPICVTCPTHLDN